MKKNITRRDMLKSSTLAAGGVCTCSALSVFGAQSDCCNTPHLELESYSIEENRVLIDLEKAASLAEAGNAAFIDKPEKNIQLIIVRPDDNKFVALSRFCTHGRQILSYNSHRRLLQCNSYNHSLFDLDGSVWKGPAPRPLDSFRVEKENQLVTIFLKEQS